MNTLPCPRRTAKAGLRVFASCVAWVGAFPGHAAAAPDPRGEAPADASSVNEVAQPHEAAFDEDSQLETATPDPTPPVPTPLQRHKPEPTIDVVEQAGVGGPTAYASAGVLEVGGAGALLASADYVTAQLAPLVGWFVYDGIELSYVHAVYASRGGPQRDALLATMAVIDASVHMPVGDRVLCFAGLGPGLLFNGEEFGLGVKARSGVDVLIGRSGIFRPGLFYTWMSTPLVDLSGVATSSRHQFGVEIAYGAMF